MAPGRPYGLGRQELFPLIGGSASSTGGVWELGVRGGDVVGRLDWLALGAIGDRWLARRGSARRRPGGGGRWTVGFHLFHSAERPTREEAVARRGNLLDLDRQGIELSASRDWRWSGGALASPAAALWDQVAPASRDVELDQRLLSLTGAWGGYRRCGLWRLQPGLCGPLRGGRTPRRPAPGPAAGAAPGSTSATTTPAWPSPGGATPRGMSARLRRLPARRRRGLAAARVGPVEPHRPSPPCRWAPWWARTTRGSGPSSPSRFLPAPIFYERHRVWGFGEPRGDWLTLAGLEYRFRLDPMPVVRLPALDLRVGVARILDDPFGEFEGSTRWWLVTAWRP